MRFIHEKPRSTPQHVNTPGELRSSDPWSLDVVDTVLSTAAAEKETEGDPADAIVWDELVARPREEGLTEIQPLERTDPDAPCVGVMLTTCQQRDVQPLLAGARGQFIPDDRVGRIALGLLLGPVGGGGQHGVDDV